MRRLGGSFDRVVCASGELRERLGAEGLDFTRFRNSLRDQILVERVREREVNQRIRVTDADIDRALQERQAQAAVGAQLNLAQILVTVPEGAAAQMYCETWPNFTLELRSVTFATPVESLTLM